MYGFRAVGDIIGTSDPLWIVSGAILEFQCRVPLVGDQNDRNSLRFLDN